MDATVGKHKAVNVTITDSGSFFDATEVEAALQEIKVKVTDDGTYYIFKIGAIEIFKVRKSDKQFLVSAGVDTDEGF